MNDATSRWRGRRVLVSGCTGFLGGAVVHELLAGGAEVVGLVRDRSAGADFFRHRPTGRVHVVHGRLDDVFRIYSALAIHEVAAVFHLAACSPNQSDRGTASVLEATHRYDPRVPVVMARPADRLDSAHHGPHSALGVARFGEVFGGGDRNTLRVVPATVISRLTGDRNPPAAAPARDFVFVRDAARAIVWLSQAVADGEAPRVEDVPFRTGWVLTDQEMVDAVHDVFDGRAPGVPRAEPPANPLGWSTAVSLGDGLAETIAWYREFLRTRFFGTKPAEPTRRAAA
jgi:CDP-glucose 4,6-dehydratase